MKVVILAGGMGTRISEYTKSLTKPIPKPMIKVCGKPIIHRIIDHYIKYGHREFIIALGYKGNSIKKYFRKIKFSEKIDIKLIDTGLQTMTGGRLKRLKKYLNQTFLMTYGDGLSNVNISKLINFHKLKKKLLTLTAVRPPARFGAIKIVNNKVKYFKEKSSLDEGWINGGFFVLEPAIFKYIKNDKTYLERAPLEKIASMGKLTAFKHHGFWQCMDTLRDKEILEKKIKNKEHLEKK
jgi:glucose-1-phosphate cytidylyltransferase